MLVYSEQWLFDIKEGYCTIGWYKARRFCCKRTIEDEIFGRVVDDPCPAWRTWAEALSHPAHDSEGEFLEYIPYAIIAVSPGVVH